jgi:hypothetical protein
MGNMIDSWASLMRLCWDDCLESVAPVYDRKMLIEPTKIGISWNL